MNDFTKEELQHILGHMKWAYDIEATEQNLLMITKIQSMIDDYCEHLGEDREDNNFCSRCKSTVEIK